MKHLNRLILVTLLLGWLFDFFFWNRPLGINFVLFLNLCLLGGVFLLLAEDFRPNKKSLWLLIPFIFFSVVTIVRQEPLTIFLAYTFILFSMGVMANTYRGGRWIQYGLADYFSKLFHLFISMTTGLLEILHRVREEQEKHSMVKKVFPLLPILRGIFIAFPIVACFATLLASADAIFNQKLVNFLESLDLDAQHFLRLVLIPLYAYLLAGVFFHAASWSGDEKLLGEEKALFKRFLGFTETGIVLGSVAALFLFFVLIQFRYFFGGEANIGVEGYTYSQYARRGFNELIIVAFLSLLMIIGLSTITRRENVMKRRAYSGLSILIVVLVLVILVSAYQRLMLAIGWHGFSRLRLYPSVFLIWVGILLVTVVLLEIFRRERYFAFAIVLASIGFAVSLALMNVDAAIVKYNILRASLGWHLNVPHLASLSTDAIPALVEEFHDPSLPTSTHEGVGAILFCYIQSYSLEPSEPTDWRSFNFSRWKAELALEGIQDELDGYRPNKKNRPRWVRTPGNAIYPCYEY